MTLKRINVGPRMADVVIHNGTAYLAGKVPSNPDGDIIEQTEDVLATIDKLLAEAGTSKENVLRAEIYLKNIDQWAQMNTVWDKWVAPDQTPTRAAVEAKMSNPKYLVEIMVTAAIPSRD